MPIVTTTSGIRNAGSILAGKDVNSPSQIYNSQKFSNIRVYVKQPTNNDNQIDIDEPIEHFPNLDEIAKWKMSIDFRPEFSVFTRNVVTVRFVRPWDPAKSYTYNASHHHIHIREIEVYDNDNHRILLKLHAVSKYVAIDTNGERGSVCLLYTSDAADE